MLFMPFLHKELCPAVLRSVFLQLSPGLPNLQAGFHVPADLPLGPQDAARYLEYERDLGIAAANGIPVHSQLAVEKQTRHLNALKETRDISAFAQGEKAETTADHHRREARLAAQKALLRVWLLEERYMEIQELEQRCQKLSGDFTTVLGVEMEDEEAAPLLLTLNTQRLAHAAGPSVPWRFLVENAAFFLPEYSTLIFTDSSICTELRGVAILFAKVHAELYLPGQTPPMRMLELAQAPLWKAFGMLGAHPERPWLAKIFSFILWDDAL